MATDMCIRVQPRCRDYLAKIPPVTELSSKRWDGGWQVKECQNLARLRPLGVIAVWQFQLLKHYTYSVRLDAIHC